MEQFWFKGRTILKHTERAAIDHAKAAKDPLWRVVFYADKADAKSIIS